MSNLPQTTETDPTLIDLMNRWAIMGKGVKTLGLQLQAEAQSISATLIQSPTIEQIVEAESAIISANKSLLGIEEKRKNTTRKFDAVAENLMIGEKTLKEAIVTAKNALLDVKQKAAADAAAETAKSDELKRAREAMANFLVKADADFKCKISEKVAELFAAALTEAVPVDQISAWIQDKKLMTFNEADFTVKQPNLKPNLNTVESVQAIWDELSAGIPVPKIYQTDFYGQLDEKFGFYEISLKNAVAAIERSNEVVAKERAEIAASVSAQETANKLAAIAVPVAEVLEPTGRALKTVYEIDVEDTESGAVRIMAAYISNLALCRAYVRVTSYRKLTVQQMATCLEAVKKKDPNFQPQGINFKSKSKL